MLSVENVRKRYGDRVVLDGASLTIGDRERVALIGPNGCGKSTLARLIVGLEEPDAGTIGGDLAGDGAAYLAQGALDAGDHDAAWFVPGIAALWRAGHLLAGGIDAPPDITLAALDALETAGGWPAYAELEETLSGLGIAHLQPNEPYGHLSGGERTKLGLAALLHGPGKLLLLDEPGNHLDIVSLIWLEDYLAGYAGAVLLISHDRALVDAVAEAVYELDPVTHQTRRYAGGYSSFLEQRAREQQSQTEAYRQQQEHIQRVEEDIRRVQQRAQRFDSTSANDYHRRIGKKVARTAKVRERRLERLLASGDRIEKPERRWEMKAGFVEAERAGDLVVEARDVAVAFGEGTLFSNLSLVVRHGERIVLTGPNGGGKTTLLRVIMGEVSPNAGTVRRGPGVRAGYLSQQQETLDLARSPLEEVRAAAAMDETAARTFLHRFLFKGDEVFTPSSALSYGQRARLALGVLILRGINLLVLDEPLNHLDIGSRERFEEALTAYSGTVIAVSHDRHFIRRFAGRLLLLQDGRLTEADPEAV